MPSPVLQALLNLLFPYDTVCPICQRWLVGSEHVICSYCEKELHRCLLSPLERIKVHEPLDSCISAFAYEGIARNLIWQLKYYRDTTIAPLLGLYMSIALLEAAPHRTWDGVVPVPLHPSKAEKRGYNQAQMLARTVAFQHRLPLRDDLLFRVKATESQTRRSREQRYAAMEGVFTAVPKARGMRILLIDDVLTTGATACACAKALQAAGAARITLLTACQA